MVPSGLAALCLLLLQTGAEGFAILPGDSLNHLEITEMALLDATVQVCRSLALAEDGGFTSPPEPLTSEAVAVACNSPKSSKTFRQAISSIISSNVRVDLRHALNASFHFDDEMFIQGRNIITEGLSVVKASNRRGNFEAARKKLGEILHPLQDFYSHSIWVELGFKTPNSNLIRAGTSIGNIADESRATCRNCDGDDCRNNILEDILKEQVLTSGYFGIVPFVSTKPEGKCSHGGAVDLTSNIEPKGGINKDTLDASHGYLHTEAANLAIAATKELLQDIRGAAGDIDFLQMMGISKGSNKALCFVIDTTGSMSDDIEAVKSVTATLINSKIGTEDEPSVYILVPFNDPGFGPLIRTTDPQLFKTIIDSLKPEGGGDFEEMSLSGLQLALTGAPSGSEIFLFTDASAKDKHLKSTVIALIERTKTVVNFMLTGDLGLRRRRQAGIGQLSSRMNASDAQLYRDLSLASGGQTIEVTKSQLSEATSIIIELSSSSLVTLLQGARSAGKADNFTFLVDDSVTNPTIYITGRSLTFTLINPSGESQESTDLTGSSIASSKLVGNFQTVRLNKQVGLWEIKMASTNPYTLKIVGQSAIDFLFDFVEASQGPFTGFDVQDTRPRAGVNGTLLVSLTGSDSATVTEVDLVESLGSGQVSGTVESQGNGNYLVRVDRMPSVEFVVRVKGQTGDSKSRASTTFQRQSSTNFRSSSLTVTADSNSVLVPGTAFSVPFSVATSGTGGNFTIRATNDRSFDSTFPASLILANESAANGTVTLSAPLNTPSGSDVTLTIEAEAPDATDTNYVVLRISVVNTVTDFTSPVCQLLSLQASCPGDCSSSMWDLSVRVSDGADGTGVDRVSLRQGNGTLNTSMGVGTSGENVTLVSYRASCCSSDVELVVVDTVGNVGTCLYTNRATTTTSSPSNNITPAAVSSATKANHSSLLVLNMAIAVMQKILRLLVPNERGIQ